MTRRSEFRDVFSKGNRVGGPVTVICRRCDEGATHVAFVASRSVGSAVRRNRAKRRMREAMRQIELHEGHDYVVIASRAVLDASFSGLVDLMQRGFDRAVGDGE